MPIGRRSRTSGYRRIRRIPRIRFTGRFEWIERFLATNLPRILLFSGIGVFLLVIGMFFWYSRDLPMPDRVRRIEGFSTVILDRNEKPLYDLYSEENRIPVPFSDIPDNLKKATIAIEDKDFYKHQGFDPKGMLRAAFYILTLRGLQGGSTLTQQLVKNVLLTSERTLPRKIKEFVLSVQIERKYSKDEILQMYLNEAPYGGTMWGIESAAQGYFGKHAKELNLTESAILAGLPQSPSYYSPTSGDEDAFKNRTEEVLRRMREEGYITDVQEKEAIKSLGSVSFASASGQVHAVHFVLWVQKQLEDLFGKKKVAEGGLRVVTTVDSDLQNQVETIIHEELDKLKGLKVSNAASVVIDPQTGEILAYAGSREYNSEDPNFEGKFDVARLGKRQPGSALKPITYATAFMKGYTPASVLMDVETHFPAGTADGKDYVPKNYDGKFKGPVQLRFALGNSINIPAVKLTALTGVKDILKNSYAMGLTTLEPTDENVKRFGLSLTLGGGEVRLIDLTQAYGVFATGGIKHDLVSILSVKDVNGKEIYKQKESPSSRVMDENITYLISNILSDNNARIDVFGPRSYLVIPGHTVAVKTGTTDDKRDNWTMGYTPSFVIGVWVGNNDNSAMDPKLASGVTGAAPIWNRIMTYALKGKKNQEFSRPSDVEEVTIDAGFGGLPYDGKPTRTEVFINGTEPTTQSPIYQKLKVSKSDNAKLANPIEIASGNYDEKEFYVFKEEDPLSSDGHNRWQEGIDAWLDKQTDPLWHAPRETSTNNEDSVVVKIKRPDGNAQINDNNFEIEAQAKSLSDIKRMELYIDDTQKSSVSQSSFTETVNLDTGVHKIKVKAYDSKDHSGESEITIGVKVPADFHPTDTPAPQPTQAPTNTPSPTP